MAWHGIQNLPPGFDVMAGKQGQLTIVDQAIRGDIPGLTPGQREQYKDLKRHLLHMDYARYFEVSMTCASFLVDIENGKYVPPVLHDIIEPALKVAVEQFRSIQKEVARFAASKRKMEYDPVSSLNQIYTKSLPIARAYPTAAGASDLEPTYRSVLAEIQRTAAAPG